MSVVNAPQHNSVDGGSTAPAGCIGGQEDDCFTLFVIMSTIHLTIQDKQYNNAIKKNTFFKNYSILFGVLDTMSNDNI